MDFSDFMNQSNAEHAMNSLEIILYQSWPGRMPDDLWDVMRRYILSRDQYTCQNCQETNTRLDVHHVVGAEIVAPITIGTNVQLVAAIKVRTYGEWFVS